MVVRKTLATVVLTLLSLGAGTVFAGEEPVEQPKKVSPSRVESIRQEERTWCGYYFTRVGEVKKEDQAYQNITISVSLASRKGAYIKICGRQEQGLEFILHEKTGFEPGFEMLTHAGKQDNGVYSLVDEKHPFFRHSLDHVQQEWINDQFLGVHIGRIRRLEQALHSFDFNRYEAHMRQAAEMNEFYMTPFRGGIFPIFAGHAEGRDAKKRYQQEQHKAEEDLLMYFSTCNPCDKTNGNYRHLDHRFWAIEKKEGIEYIWALSNSDSCATRTILTYHPDRTTTIKMGFTKKKFPEDEDWELVTIKYRQDGYILSCENINEYNAVKIYEFLKEKRDALVRAAK